MCRKLSFNFFLNKTFTIVVTFITYFNNFSRFVYIENVTSYRKCSLTLSRRKQFTITCLIITVSCNGNNY